MALVLSRKVSQVTRFMLGDKCLGTETIHEANGGRAKIAYDFDKSVRIIRSEVPLIPDSPIQRDETEDCRGAA